MKKTTILAIVLAFQMPELFIWPNLRASSASPLEVVSRKQTVDKTYATNNNGPQNQGSNIGCSEQVVDLSLAAKKNSIVKKRDLLKKITGLLDDEVSEPIKRMMATLEDLNLKKIQSDSYIPSSEENSELLKLKVKVKFGYIKLNTEEKIHQMVEQYNQDHNLIMLFLFKQKLLLKKNLEQQDLDNHLLLAAQLGVVEDLNSALSANKSPDQGFVDESFRRAAAEGWISCLNILLAKTKPTDEALGDAFILAYLCKNERVLLFMEQNNLLPSPGKQYNKFFDFLLIYLAVLGDFDKLDFLLANNILSLKATDFAFKKIFEYLPPLGDNLDNLLSDNNLNDPKELKSRYFVCIKNLLKRGFYPQGDLSNINLIWAARCGKTSVITLMADKKFLPQPSVIAFARQEACQQTDIDQYAKYKTVDLLNKLVRDYQKIMS